MEGMHAIEKEASEIGVGDIVFCQVQRSQQYRLKAPDQIDTKKLLKHDYTAKGIHAVAYPASIQRACSTAQAGPHR